MSRADERRAEHARREREQDAAQRPAVMVKTAEPESGERRWWWKCGGARDGFHRRSSITPEGRWRCQFCGQTFPEPTAEDYARLRSRTEGDERGFRSPSRGRW